MKKIKNKNGFTLVELLAVIVILAILILLALPNVLKTMEQARKNAFKVEVQEILKNVETAYSMESMKGNVVNNGGVRYLCMNLSDLYNEGYSNKDFANMSYSGFAEVFVPNNGNAVFGINISNGVYSFVLATPEKLAKDVQPSSKFTSIPTKCKVDANGKKTGVAWLTADDYATGSEDSISNFTDSAVTKSGGGA